MSARPSVTVFRTFLLHALTYWAEIVYVILFLLTLDQDWVSLISINLTLDIAILLPVKFRWIPFSGFRGEVENVSANQRPGRPSCFYDRPENKIFVEDVEILLPHRRSPQRGGWSPKNGQNWPFLVKFSDQRGVATPANLPLDPPMFLSSFVEFRLAVSEEKSKISQPIRG